MRTIDVEFMPRWKTQPGDRYPKPVDEPVRRAVVRVELSDGLYGYEVDTGIIKRFEFFGGESWRDRETATAFCESAAHALVSRMIGPVKTWSVRC